MERHIKDVFGCLRFVCGTQTITLHGNQHIPPMGKETYLPACLLDRIWICDRSREGPLESLAVETCWPLSRSRSLCQLWTGHGRMWSGRRVLRFETCWDWGGWLGFVPIGSMSGIFTFRWIFMVNVAKYTIHGSCGVGAAEKSTP